MVHEVVALGVRIPVHAHASDAAALERLFAPWNGTPGSDASLELGPEVQLDTVTEANLEERASALSSFATFAALEQLRGRELLLHAAGIADDAGRVAAFVGPSGRGKTTASRALGRHYGYVSDETVAVEASGRVRSYRKPLSVIVGGRRHKEQLAPSELGLLPLPDAPLVLGALALLDRDPGRAPSGADASLEPVALCAAIAELVPQASYLAELPEPLQLIARLVDRVGGVRRVRYSEAESLPAIVPALFDDRAAARPWRAVLPEASGRPDSPYRAAPTLDAIESDGQTAVLLEGGMLHLLDGIGPGVWRAVLRGAAFEDVVAAVVDEYGPPPEASVESAVRAALDGLVAARVILERGGAA